MGEAGFGLLKEKGTGLAGAGEGVDGNSRWEWKPLKDIMATRRGGRHLTEKEGTVSTLQRTDYYSNRACRRGSAQTEQRRQESPLSN